MSDVKASPGFAAALARLRGSPPMPTKKKRRWVIAFGPMTIPPRQSVVLSAQPGCYFQSEKLIVTANVLANPWRERLRKMAPRGIGWFRKQIARLLYWVADHRSANCVIQHFKAGQEDYKVTVDDFLMDSEKRGCFSIGDVPSTILVLTLTVYNPSDKPAMFAASVFGAVQQ